MCVCVCIYIGIYTGIHAGKESACNAEDLALIPEMERSPGEGKDYPLQYSGLENSMECVVHGVAKSRTQLSDFHLLTYLLGEEISLSRTSLGEKTFLTLISLIVFGEF